LGQGATGRGSDVRQIVMELKRSSLGGWNSPPFKKGKIKKGLMVTKQKTGSPSARGRRGMGRKS